RLADLHTRRRRDLPNHLAMDLDRSSNDVPTHVRARRDHEVVVTYGDVTLHPPRDRGVLRAAQIALDHQGRAKPRGYAALLPTPTASHPLAARPCRRLRFACFLDEHVSRLSFGGRESDLA